MWPALQPVYRGLHAQHNYIIVYTDRLADSTSVTKKRAAVTKKAVQIYPFIIIIMVMDRMFWCMQVFYICKSPTHRFS